MRILICIVTLLLAGCMSTAMRKPTKEMSAEEALGSYFVFSALNGKTSMSDFLTIVYPLRSQIVTFSIIGFHRDRGAWPESETALVSYIASSPANPTIPEGALIGIIFQKKEDGGIVYSTSEDRQRGREFTISSKHRVSFPVPSYAYASPTSAAAPVSQNTKIGLDWSDALIQAIIKATLK